MQKDKLRLPLAAVAREKLKPEAMVVLPLVEAEAAAGPPAPVQEGGGNLSNDPPVFVAMVGKKQLRRLHHREGCGAAFAELREMIPLEDLQGAEYHAERRPAKGYR